MKRCKGCGNDDPAQFEPFSVSSFVPSMRGTVIREGWRCIKCSRIKLIGEA
jgi:hypothetical protein